MQMVFSLQLIPVHISLFREVVFTVIDWPIAAHYHLLPQLGYSFSSHCSWDIIFWGLAFSHLFKSSAFITDFIMSCNTGKSPEVKSCLFLALKTWEWTYISCEMRPLRNVVYSWWTVVNPSVVSQYHSCCCLTCLGFGATFSELTNDLEKLSSPWCIAAV